MNKNIKLNTVILSLLAGILVYAAIGIGLAAVLRESAGSLRDLYWITVVTMVNYVSCLLFRCDPVFSTLFIFSTIMLITAIIFAITKKTTAYLIISHIVLFLFLSSIFIFVISHNF